MAKSPKKSREQQSSTAEAVLSDSIDVLSLGLDAIRKEIRLISSGKGGDSKHDSASRIAFLTGRVGAIADSVRKVEAARSKRLQQITKGTVLEWLRQLDAGERAQVMAEIEEMNRKRSVLG